MCRLLGLHYLPSFPHGLGTAWVKALAHLAHWTSTSTIPLPAMAMGLLAALPAMLVHWSLLSLSLGFPGLFTLSLPLIDPMGLLAVIPATLAHLVYYLFSWASPAHLLCLYLLLIAWAC